MTQMGTESKKEWVWTESLIHFAIQQKLTQHCKSTILQYQLIKKDCPTEAPSE